LFFMDYANKTRLKLLGRAKAAGPDDAGVLEKLAVPGYRAAVERGLLITVEAFEWNCPQHIAERVTLEEVQGMSATLLSRIADLEAQLGAREGGQDA